MTFTTGETINFHSPIEMQFWSNVSMTFDTGIKMQFVDLDMDGVIMPCDIIQVMPPGYLPPPCSWWEVLDPQGNPIGEMHIDGQYPPNEVHIDMVFPGPIPAPPGFVLTAVKKIEIIQPCDYYVVEQPRHWYPPVCSWWEIMDPETGQPTGYEFHVDWNNVSCEFHIDEVTPKPYVPHFPGAYQIEARKKTSSIAPCDWFVILNQVVPLPCSWWEIVQNGVPTGLEFHVDTASGVKFHVDQVIPNPLNMNPTYPVTARKKVSVIQQCDWFKVDDLAQTPALCTWWRIRHPNIGDVEFHVDVSNPDGTFHVDVVLPATQFAPVYLLTAEQKFAGISPCDWFKVRIPEGYLPQPCSWWRITSPPQWAGVRFHVDASDGIDQFHIDQLLDQLPPGPVPPPWNVTAESFETWYYKPSYIDYAPSGMPDFNQMQDNWINPLIGWSWCGPVSVANSLWWLDSKFEPNPVSPPAINDHFPLVVSYSPGMWDDHDSRNVIPLVNNLGFLMDTDGQRTGLPHTGTNLVDLETGISQYLQQHGVDPVGDCDGDGKVEADDLAIINAAMGSVPGAPNWNMAADVVTNNAVNPADLAAATANLGKMGMFYEHTTNFPAFDYIRNEILRCEDVELLVEVWNEVAPGQWQKWTYDPGGNGGHYVTCAGVSTITNEVAISDPWQDAFEAGMAPGRSPVPHPYPHVPSVHNDAQFVSHDAYSVALWLEPPPSPYPGMPILELLGYPATWGLPPTYHAFLRASIETSPLGVHDVAVLNVWDSKQGCSPKPTVGKSYPVRINATVENQGNFTETFNVTAYAGANVVGTQLVSNLLVGERRTLAFVWNTAGLSYGNYTISATATQVSGETDTADNTFTDGNVLVTIPGDVDGNYVVNIFDVVRITGSYGKRRGDQLYNPNADLDDNNVVNIFDVVICTGNYGKKYP
jgi:hypothetical protein